MRKQAWCYLLFEILLHYPSSHFCDLGVSTQWCNISDNPHFAHTHHSRSVEEPKILGSVWISFILLKTENTVTK